MILLLAIPLHHVLEHNSFFLMIIKCVVIRPSTTKAYRTQFMSTALRSSAESGEVLKDHSLPNFRSTGDKAFSRGVCVSIYVSM